MKLTHNLVKVRDARRKLFDAMNLLDELDLYAMNNLDPWTADEVVAAGNNFEEALKTLMKEMVELEKNRVDNVSCLKAYKIRKNLI